MTAYDDQSQPSGLEAGLEQSIEMERMVNDPARLLILAALSGSDEVSFKYLTAITKLSRGNLSIQMSKLADAGYVTVHKRFQGKVPSTSYSITQVGQQALDQQEQRMVAFIQGLQNQKKRRQQQNQANALANQNTSKPLPSTS